jgi:hypothetical protein
MGDFRKTLIMNVVLASGYAIYGVAMLLGKMQNAPLVDRVFAVGACAVLVLIPAANARALSSAGSPGLQRAILRADWVMIGLAGLVAIGTLVDIALSHMPDRWIAVLSIELGVLFVILPWWLNIRALRSLLASRNAASAPQAKRIEREEGVRSPGS